MIEISAELNRVLFDAIHAVVGMACDRGVCYPDCGLCLNVEKWVEIHHPYYRTVDFYRLLANIFEDMGLSRSYPVRHPKTGYMGGLWSGSQLKLRMDLCSKLMSYLDIQLVQTIFSEKHETLLPALKALSFLPASAIPRPQLGICANARALVRSIGTDTIYYDLNDHFRAMGFEDPVQPIGYRLGLKWVGEEGIARRQLLADLIAFLEAKNVSTT